MNTSSAKLLYEGSVKNLWEKNIEELEFEFTDAYSVFDWGRMPDKLFQKGESLAAVGEYFFKKLSNSKTFSDQTLVSQISDIQNRLKNSGYPIDLIESLETLQRSGLKNHFLKRTEKNRILVKKVHVIKPSLSVICGQSIYDYSNQSSAVDKGSERLIPLEVVFRFGAPQGSSFFERWSESYAKLLGHKFNALTNTMQFDFPVIEFFSKLEATDRYLSYEQALNYSHIGFKNFIHLIEKTIIVALIIKNEFSRSETKQHMWLDVWDGKLEWAFDSKTNEVILVDSIGPDELRILDVDGKIQFSKEFLRQFYRKKQAQWYDSYVVIKKTETQKGNLNWKFKVLSSIGEPPKLDPEFLSIAQSIYPTLATLLTGENFKYSSDLKDLKDRMSKCF